MCRPIYHADVECLYTLSGAHFPSPSVNPVSLSSVTYTRFYPLFPSFPQSSPSEQLWFESLSSLRSGEKSIQNLQARFLWVLPNKLFSACIIDCYFFCTICCIIISFLSIYLEIFKDIHIVSIFFKPYSTCQKWKVSCCVGDELPSSIGSCVLKPAIAHSIKTNS